MTLRTRYLSTTLVLVAVGLGYAVTQGRAVRSSPSLPARPQAASQRGFSAPPPPTAREILGRGAVLSLTADQKTRLEALDRGWREESAPLEAALQEAEREFTRFMEDTRASGRTTVEEIQRRSADVRELSAARRERRRIHSEVAAQVLTESQRRRLAASPSPETPGGAR
jgi:phytoene dehydrogenase-like protein